MKKSDVVRAVLGERYLVSPRKNSSGKQFAPTNIALCKYWGKRDQELNLPVTSSLSISLGNKGATTELKTNHGSVDAILLNGLPIDFSSAFSERLRAFLDLFREQSACCFDINIESSVPIAAGLASSACGFASVVQALNALFDWNLSPQELSLLSRLGSGSASRSIWHGFVEWQVGIQNDGMDSYASKLDAVWPDLSVGLLITHASEKNISSRVAMQRTVTTSALYSAWPLKVSRDLFSLKQAIQERDFELLGATAESNATTMHATMLSAWPPVIYAMPETLSAMQAVWKLRDQGLPLYFTQDAGPNLKLLFLKKDTDTVRSSFPSIEVVQPFDVN